MTPFKETRELGGGGEIRRETGHNSQWDVPVTHRLLLVVASLCSRSRAAPVKVKVSAGWVIPKFTNSSSCSVFSFYCLYATWIFFFFALRYDWGGFWVNRAKNRAKLKLDAASEFTSTIQNVKFHSFDYCVFSAYAFNFHNRSKASDITIPPASVISAVSVVETKKKKKRKLTFAFVGCFPGADEHIVYPADSVSIGLFAFPSETTAVREQHGTSRAELLKN